MGAKWGGVGGGKGEKTIRIKEIYNSNNQSMNSECLLKFEIITLNSSNNKQMDYIHYWTLLTNK